MKNSTKLKVPKKYQHMIDEVQKDCDGWWAYSKDGYIFESTSCHTAHEYNQNDLLKEIRTLIKE